MLEHRVLLVRSPPVGPASRRSVGPASRRSVGPASRRSVGPASRRLGGTGVSPVAVREIVDGDSGAALGYARWEAELAPWWRRIFGRGVLAVHEQEDEPLLLTIRRAWMLSARRRVCDADGQPIGDLLGRLIHDRYGRPLAALENGVFRAPDRRALAGLDSTAEGLRLTFHDDIAGEPFVKMLLLAAALQVG